MRATRIEGSGNRSKVPGAESRAATWLVHNCTFVQVQSTWAESNLVWWVLPARYQFPARCRQRPSESTSRSVCHGGPLVRQNLPLSTINFAALLLTLAGCGGGYSSGGNGNSVAPYVTTQPMNQTVTAGQTATFMVVASGTAPLTYQWQKNGANIAGATSSSYATPATAISDSGSTFVVVVSNSAGTATSNAATLTVTAMTSGSTDVITHHYDVSRSGVNSTEAALTTSNVNSGTFGKVGEFTVDGQIDGQALFLSQLAIP